MKTAIVIASAAALAACTAAETPENEAAVDHSAMDHSQHMDGQAAMSGDPTEAQQAYIAVNNRMHEGMPDIPADADEAFMRGMLAHHIGAVEMSEVALAHGKDAQVRDLAQRIIDAQAAEIEEMETWLAARETAASE